MTAPSKFAHTTGLFCLTLLTLANAIPKEPLLHSKRPGEAAVRLREGSKISDVLGRIDLVGDQTTFTPADGGESFRLIENLALERINQTLGDSREKSQWEVSGVVTEYRGGNYLIVTKAVIKASGGATASPAPSPRKSEK